MVRYRAALTALALAAGFASAPAFASGLRDVQPIPFDGKTGVDPGYSPHLPRMNCMVVGASCNKGPMPPWMSDRGHNEHGYPGHDRGFPGQWWPRTMHDKGLGGPF
jgi:hypothetical protein